MKDERAAKVLQILQKEFTTPRQAKMARDPFATFVIAILSQNTADHNTAMAFKQLSSRFKISPEVLAYARTEEIEDAIKPAGLFKNKAKTIRHAATLILEKYEGTLKPILSLPLEEARLTLMQFPGVGPKTADVVLLFSSRKPTIPVDTHVNRVAKRLGFAPFKGKYETVRRSLQSLFKPREYFAIHVLLISHVMKICKAMHPYCNHCPVNEYCPTKGQW